MMRSLFSGVSGLKNHQTRMDVIGNNIANVNTTGFKASRVNFQDILSQTMQGASAAQTDRGGTNPMQVGLGMGVASIDTIFTDGSYQTTGKQTDLSVKGQGFFIVSDGTSQYYTRAGNFDFDADGNYVVPGTGLKVMGWMADNAGAINTTGPITSIQIPVGTAMPPQVSTEITIANNLSADGKGSVVGVPNADTAMTFTGTLDAAANVGTMVSFTVQTYLESGAQVPVTVNFKKTGNPGNNVWDVTTNGNSTPVSFTVGAASINLPIDNGKGGTTPIVVTSSGITAAGTSTVSGTVNAPTAADAAVKMSGVVPADAETNDTVNTTISVIDATAAHNRISIPVTLKKTATANQWEVSSTTAGVTFVPTTFTIGSTTPIAVTLTTPAAQTFNLNTSAITTGKTAASNTSLNVYDSLGTAHKVEYTFSKSGIPGQWIVSAKVDGAAAIVTNDKVTFNSEGVLISPTSPITGPLVTVPGSSGAASFPVTMNLFLENGTTPAVTQYSGESTVQANSTDGYAAGTLQKVVADTNGILTGQFSNNRTLAMGQVALATFNNASGLEKSGDNYFVKSANSGEAQIGAAGSGGRGTFTPGSLEMSNVDLAQQFSDMIITQRGFQANSKIITTTDEMLELLANLKR